MDYFFAQVEELKDPRLKKYPVGIGGRNGRGVLCTSNYEARKYGVKSAMPTQVALRKCPHLKLVPPCFEDYKKVSQKVFEIFSRYTDKIEGLSLDEAYLDVTDCDLFSNSAYLIAKDIRQTIYEETQLTCSAGISFNKFFAKLGSEYNKPNGQFLIPPNVCKKFVGDIDVQKINGVGKVSLASLNKRNIFKLKDLWKYEKYELYNYFGKFGGRLYNFSRGIDYREVQPDRIRKSLSVENTFSEDISSLESLNEKFSKLYEKFRARLKGHEDKIISTSFVKIKYHDFDLTTIERKFNSLDYENFYYLLKERFGNRVSAIRLLGIGVKFNTTQVIEQLSLPFL